MTTVWVILVVLLIGMLVLAILWNRVRATANFTLIYRRALRAEGSREVAIAAALEHLRSFLPPFVGLSDNEISATARLFSDIDEPA